MNVKLIMKWMIWYECFITFVQIIARKEKTQEKKIQSNMPTWAFENKNIE